MNKQSKPKLIRMKTVCELLGGIARSTLYDWINPDSPRFKEDFPKRVKIGRMVFWRLSEVEEFILSQAEME